MFFCICVDHWVLISQHSTRKVFKAIGLLCYQAACLRRARSFNIFWSSNNIFGLKVVEEEVEDSDADENIHAFYYAWYGNTDADDKFVHWNHPFLSHWKKEESNKYATGSRHKPPNDIGTLIINFVFTKFIHYLKLYWFLTFSKLL